jgi:hypothetical protein
VEKRQPFFTFSEAFYIRHGIKAMKITVKAGKKVV